ncbi:MAG: hypothetical protein OEZ57_05740 [Nitrospirota bacterium]|nr:hypothetical protein [Nitrospirota bacterium]MDH5774402.1 hypothetical protein [Nitrospirota bacterium]
MSSLSRRTVRILGFVCLTILSAFLLEYVLTTTPIRPFGHTQPAHLVGWIGLGIISLTFVYPLKRWWHPNQVWPKRWFHVHMVAGILGPLIIFIHAGVHFHAWVPILALVTMVLVVVSGIVGQALHYWMFQLLYERRHQQDFEGLSEEAVEARLHDLALQEKALRWWKCLHGPLTWSFVALTMLHLGGALFYGGL